MKKGVRQYKEGNKAARKKAYSNCTANHTFISLQNKNKNKTQTRNKTTKTVATRTRTAEHLLC